MDLKSYIESGIIEQVALGLGSEQEAREVQCMMTIYPEIRAEFDSFAELLESNAADNAAEPDPSVKIKVMEAISSQPKLTAVPDRAETKTVEMLPQEGPNFWKFATAAAVAGVIVVAGFWYTSNRRATDYSNRLASLETKMDAAEQAMTAMNADQEKMASIHKVLADKMTRDMEMTGMPKSPESAVKIMYNSDMKKAVMVAESIPDLPNDMIYQLWAIKDGKPISLGLFDKSDLNEMTEPFAIPSGAVSAYAITMEPRGGVQNPTMENMMVIGNVNS